MTSLDDNDIHTIVYFSSARGWRDNTLSEILETSRKNNDRLGLTGFILVVDGSILQWLEGPKSVVTERFDLIKNDPRHQQLSEVFNRSLGQRYFKSWLMGFIPQSNMSPQLMENFINLSSPHHRVKFIEEAPRLAQLFADNFLSLNRS